MCKFSDNYTKIMLSTNKKYIELYNYYINSPKACQAFIINFVQKPNKIYRQNYQKRLSKLYV